MSQFDWLEITSDPIDAAKVIAFVSDARAGGIDVFLGTTRGERNADGRDLLALDYEAYADMANKQLAQLAADARRRWPSRRSSSPSPARIVRRRLKRAGG